MVTLFDAFLLFLVFLELPILSHPVFGNTGNICTWKNGCTASEQIEGINAADVEAMDKLFKRLTQTHGMNHCDAATALGHALQILTHARAVKANRDAAKEDDLAVKALLELIHNHLPDDEDAVYKIGFAVQVLSEARNTKAVARDAAALEYFRKRFFDVTGSNAIEQDSDMVHILHTEALAAAARRDAAAEAPKATAAAARAAAVFVFVFVFVLVLATSIQACTADYSEVAATTLQGSTHSCGATEAGPHIS